jgi:hypothetical protein
MGASERVAALRRARERQARIEAATGRTIRAQTSLARAVEAKALAIERYDERIATAEESSATETAELAKVCGSAEAAAEILGCSVRDLQRVLKAEKERRAASAPPTRRSSQDRTHTGGGGTDASSA